MKVNDQRNKEKNNVKEMLEIKKRRKEIRDGEKNIIKKDEEL